MFRVLLLISCAATVLTACSSNDKKDPLLEEAAQYHNEATQIQKMVEPQIEQIDSLKTRLANQPQPAAKATIVRLDSLKKAFEDWEANRVEVPGMPHEHHHEHGKHEHHHHTDATLKDLPADQMRDLQREARDQIRQIQQRTEASLKPVESLGQ
ncbi:hypothetical protein ACFQ4C_03285 [Larkinella insperata]|uniref:Lipoprotein n=1 Tax=Larkinella insperata TaxID=332158 RepID=A0ABW3Q9R6_9BACT|nr:hypothetical protein [Larkinella insperata]